MACPVSTAATTATTAATTTTATTTAAAIINILLTPSWEAVLDLEKGVLRRAVWRRERQLPRQLLPTSAAQEAPLQAQERFRRLHRRRRR